MKEKPLIFEFCGGFGNQIFQYLASKYIAKNNKKQIIFNSYEKYRKFDIKRITKEEIIFSENSHNVYSLNDISTKIISKYDLLKKERFLDLFINFGFLNRIEEHQIKILKPNSNPLKYLLEIIKKLKSKQSLKITGFWQNPSLYSYEIKKYYKYFKNTKNILPDFIVPNNYIAIHIRRGDYISNQQIYNYYFSRFSPISFINTALNLIPSDFENLPIFIVTDDPKWVNHWKDQIIKNKKRELKIFNSLDPIFDWSILRYSKLNICANSTFSITASFLNEENINSKIRAIIPQWISIEESAINKGWLSFPGFIEI